METEILPDAPSSLTVGGWTMQRPFPGKLLIPAVAVLVLIVFVFSLLIDLTPRFHMGDSAVFILTGQSGFIPDNRSWTYGLAIGWLLRTTGLLASVALAQIVLSWTAFTLFAVAVTKSTNTRFPFGLLLIFIGALEPLGYYWSRSMMTDSPAQSLFVLICAFLLLPLKFPLRIALVFPATFALIGFRVVFFPALAAAIAFTVAWLLVAYRPPEVADRSGASRSWAAIFGVILLANLGYAYANTYATRARTLSTNIGDMEFLVGALSPLMESELGNTPLTANERNALVPLTYDNRVSNTFNPHGLVPLIRAHFSSTENARPIMRKLVFDAIDDHPVEFAKLVLRQWGDYLNPSLVLHAHRAGMLTGAVPQFRNDPRTVLPNYIVAILRKWNVRPPARADFPSQPSPALTYVENFGGVWSLILAYYGTFALVWLFIVPANYRTPFLVFINSFAFLYMLTIVLGANQIVTRYLLPLDVPLLYTVTVALRYRRDPRR